VSSQSNQIENLLAQRDHGRSAESAAALESKLEDEKSQRKIERFFWILAVMILADCVLFKLLDSTFSDIFIALLSLILVIGCAKWLEVPYVGQYLDRTFDRMLASKPTALNQEETEET
jgi:hypothetical protein